MAKVSTEPTWVRQIRQCRICHDLSLPAVYVGERGEARPLFYEEGDYSAELLFILEAPNDPDTFDRDKGRMTFGEYSDETGRFFEDCLRDELKIDISNVMITNSVLCLPPLDKNDDFKVDARQRRNCKSNLTMMLDNVDPRVVVTLGREALIAIGGIEKHKLTTLRDSAVRPYNWYGRILFPLYHPGPRGRANRVEKLQRSDYRKLRQLLLKKGIIDA